MDVVDFPRQLRHLRAAVMHTVLQPLFYRFRSTGPLENSSAGLMVSSFRLFCGGELGAGFADMGGVAFARKFFIGFVLAADFAVVAVGTA